MAHNPDDRRLSAITGTAFYCIFSLLGVLVSGFLTIVKFRSAVQCDESLLSACQIGAYFDCNTVLTSPWSIWFDFPISIYATAFYLAGLGVSVWLLRSTSEQLAASRPLLLLHAWIGVVVVLPLAWYAAFEVGSLCTFCVLIYLVNVVLLLAACLLNPRGPIGGFADLVAPAIPRRATTALTAVLIFSASLTVQMAVYMRNAINTEVEPQCIKRGGVLPNAALVRGKEAEPEAEIALFVDFACPACRTEYTHWRQDIEAASNRYRLSLYHFPREGECLAGGTSFNPNSVRHHACRAARALECFKKKKPDAGWAMADALFAAHDRYQGSLFSTPNLAEIAGELGLRVDTSDPDDPFIACINSDEQVLQQIHEHARFGLARGLTETPGTFFVFFHPDGRPMARIPLVKGAKQYYDIDDYIARTREKVLDELEHGPVEL